MKLYSFIVFTLLIFGSCNRLKAQSNPHVEYISEFNKFNTGLDGEAKKMVLKCDTLFNSFHDHSTSSFKTATTIRKLSDTLLKYLEKIKTDLDIEKNGNTDLSTGTDYFIKQGNGDSLKNKLAIFKQRIGSITNNKIAASIKLDLPESVPKNQMWSQYYFDMVPLIADIAELSKFEQDVYNIEYDALLSLKSQ